MKCKKLVVALCLSVQLAIATVPVVAGTTQCPSITASSFIVKLLVGLGLMADEPIYYGC